VPMLWRYRQAVGRTGETRLGRLTLHYHSIDVRRGDKGGSRVCTGAV
jgi:hypothetical protein